MSLATDVVKGVEEAKKALADLVISVPLTKVGTSTYNTSTGKLTPSESTPTIEMCVTAFGHDEIDGTNVRSDDLKGVVFTVSQDIDSEDRVTIGGVEYKVCGVQRHFAGEILVLYEVHLRK